MSRRAALRARLFSSVSSGVIVAAMVIGGACTIEDAVLRRPDGGALQDASMGGSAGSGGIGVDAGGGAGEADVQADGPDDSDGAQGGQDGGEAGEAGAAGGAEDGGEAGMGGEAGEVDAGCGEGEVECSVAGAPECWNPGTDCATVTFCQDNWMACAAGHSPHCGSTRPFACCPANLPVFCDVSGPVLGCWESGIDCSTLKECSGEWYGCEAGWVYTCGQGCQQP